MPVKPVCGKIDLPVESAADVAKIFETGVKLSRADLSRRYEDYTRDLDDYFYYIGAVCPEYFRPLHDTLIALPDEQLANFSFTIHTWLYLLHDASDAFTERLIQRLNDDDHSVKMLGFTLEHMLMGIGTPLALTALADYARAQNRVDDFATMGFWIPDGAQQAVPRFTRHRQAVHLAPFAGTVDELARCRHPVGLPVTAVMAEPAQDVVTWHYCSLDLTAIQGLPAISATRLHIVSPPQNLDWVVFCELVQDNRYARPILVSDEGVDEEESVRMREQAHEYANFGQGQITLLPYDDKLIYRNGHTELTPGVEGDVGGPPIGLNPTPSCLRCGKLMFHIAAMTNNIREYGDGFRSLFLCEDCAIAASHATGWN